MRHSWPELLQRAELEEFYRELVPNARCAAINDDGVACKSRPMAGLDWCYRHGSEGGDDLLLLKGLERAQEARAILAEAAPMAATRLAHVAITGTDETSYKAAQAVLDRVGVRAGVEVIGTVTHEVEVAPPLQLLLERLEAIEQRRAAIPVRSQVVETVALEPGDSSSPSG